MENFEYRHIFCRGIEKRLIFTEASHKIKFQTILRLSRLKNSPSASIIKRQSKLEALKSTGIRDWEEEFGPSFIDILAYCLMGNHYHLVVKVIVDDDGKLPRLTKFMSRVNNSYTKYFNTLNERSGRLFESSFKSVPIDSDEQLLQVVRYTHINPVGKDTVIDDPTGFLRNYSWSSLRAYLQADKVPWLNLDEVLGFYKNSQDFWKFTVAGLKTSDFGLLNSDLRLDN